MNVKRINSIIQEMENRQERDTWDVEAMLWLELIPVLQDSLKKVEDREVNSFMAKAIKTCKELLRKYSEEFRHVEPTMWDLYFVLIGQGEDERDNAMLRGTLPFHV